MPRRREHRCTGDGCSYCEAEISREEDRRSEPEPMSERDWDAWEAGPGWNNIDGLRGA